MALSDLFCLPKTIARHRQPPLGGFQDGFQEWMCRKGFSPSTMRHHVLSVTHLSEYLADRQDLLQQPIDVLLQESDSCLKSRHRSCRYSVNRFLAYVDSLGTAVVGGQVPSVNATLMQDYLDWLADYGDCAPATVDLRRDYLRRFFDFDGNRPLDKMLAILTANDIQQRFLDYANTHGLSARRSMQATLRTFLHFCFYTRLTSHDLSSAVPPFRTYRLSVLPRGLSEQSAELVFTLIDRQTKVGKRDYAIISLLYHYGVRGGQVRALRFCHIDWRQGQIHFLALKHGKTIIVPFVNDVGDALLDYVQHARPQSDADEVFLTSRAPYQPLLRSSALSEITGRYLRGAEPALPSCGAHVFRHGFATRLLQQGNSLKTIADLLGHRCLQTTMVYTKVHHDALQTAALELPMEATS